MIILSATIKIDNDTTFTLNHSNALSLDRNIFDRADLEFPSFGVISNSGNLRFIDSKGYIKQLATDQILKSGMEVNFYLSNTQYNSQANVGHFLTKKWSYDTENKQVDVSLEDELIEWQDINIIPATYNPYFQKDLSGVWLYNYLYELTPTKYNMLNFEQLDESTRQRLNNTKFQFFILEVDNLWGSWSQLCELCQCHIYKNSKGQTVCRYNGGN